MPTIGQLVVNLIGNAKPFTNEVRNAQSTVHGLSNSMAQAAVVAGAIGTAYKAVSLAASYESTEAAFGVMLKSATEAKRVLADLAQFAATTPFQLPQVEDSAKQLLGYGFAANELIPALRQLGDISAALKIPLNDLVYLYGTSSTQAHLFARDIQQFSGRGIPIIAELARVLRVAKSDVMQLVEQGQVNFGHLQEAIKNMTSEGGQFENTMSAASKTLEGRFSNLQDAVTLALRDIGTEMVKTFAIKEIVEAAIGYVGALQSAIHDYGQDVLLVAGIIAGMTAGILAARVALYAYNAALAAFKAAQGAATVAAAAFQIVTNPAFLVQLSAGILGATLMMNAMYDSLAQSTGNFGQFSTGANQAAKAVSSLNQAASGTKVDLQKLPGELEKQIKILQDIKNSNHGSTLPGQSQHRQDSAIAGIDALTNLAPEADTAKEKINALWKAYGMVLEAQELVGSHKFSLQGIEDQIGKLTGISKEIEHINEQIQEATLGHDQSQLDKFFAAGATPAQISELRKKYEELNKIKKDQKDTEDSKNAAKKLYDETRTPLEKYEAEIARLNKLKKEGHIDDELLDRGVKAAKKELDSSKKKSSDEPLNAIAAKSAEAQKIVLKAMSQGSGDPNKAVEQKIDGTNKILTQINGHLAAANANKNHPHSKKPHVERIDRI